MVKMRRSIPFAIACACVCSMQSAAQEPFFMGLGDLVGGEVRSEANAISADGTTVVGESQSVHGLEAFYWTQQSGMVGLGDLAGGDFWSAANAVSSDGFIIAGEAFSSAIGFEAFRWTPKTGMVGLGDLPG